MMDERFQCLESSHDSYGDHPGNPLVSINNEKL